jgi:hypothetical protein
LGKLLQLVMQDSPTGLVATRMCPQMWQRGCWVNRKSNPCNVAWQGDDDAVKRARN